MAAPGWNDSVVPPDGSVDYYLALTQWEKLQKLSTQEVDKQIAKQMLGRAAAIEIMADAADQGLVTPRNSGAQRRH